MHVLYVVATPIGNLEDISLRALRLLKEVRLIAAEDTRKTKRLLDHYGINTPMTSYYEHNKITKLGYLLRFLETDDLALVSEAGMPGISDPGYELIVAAAGRGIRVVPVPGPSAITTAVAVAGLPTDQFVYLGFLPRKKSQRLRLLEEVSRERRTLVAFEAPHRLTESLSDILAVLGNRRVAITRELTKLHEEVFRGTMSEAVEHFQQPKGEFTIVIDGRHEKPTPSLTGQIEHEIAALQRRGVPAREAIASLSHATGLARKDLYRAWLRTKKGAKED
ncbi:MAG: 16S rRNA (cytidine(1402)-2'-O)-methyltransferase [Dehalococcoidia bacterium]|nr:16S rRNA (cytidine(1402)-2'-O)-methyltransferase [Dehalococcoidia bacterium]